MKRAGSRRWIAMLCILCMLFTGMPVSVYADTAPATPTDQEPAMTETPEEPERPKADRDLKIGSSLTIHGALEGTPPADYLVRFQPAEDQTMYLILTSDAELNATVTDEVSGEEQELLPCGADEEGLFALTAADYVAKNEGTYLVRISGDEPAEFTLRMVQKSVLEAEQATDLTKGL